MSQKSNDSTDSRKQPPKLPHEHPIRKSKPKEKLDPNWPTKSIVPDADLYLIL